jgi:LysM repeat protein
MTPSRRQLARLGAPAAFLLGVTIAVLLVRAGLQGGSPVPTGSTVTAGHVTTRTTRTHHATTTHGAATTPSGAQYVTVKKGDTFGSIAAATGTTVAAIEALNPGVSSNALQVGQKIRVK